MVECLSDNEQSGNKADCAALLAELPICDYGEIWRLQKQLVSWRQCGWLTRDLFLVLEHQPVMTIGRGGCLDHVHIDLSRLAERGIALYQTERGGEITFHAPGQLVVYGICDLRGRSLSVRSYIQGLETVMIRVARDWGVPALADTRRRGVWVGEKKLGSIGIAVKHGISFHGLALNVDLDLTPFRWISPCGLSGVEMTSLANECRDVVDVADVRQGMIEQLQHVFQVDFTSWQFGDAEGKYETGLVATGLHP
ncbi:MAG: lipoyl(octanoyl) transferase LipB [Desulfuromonas sp.]|nr:lipoyl(octanoyl) transferase LipB [Desulfuromonas sp.]